MQEPEQKLGTVVFQFTEVDLVFDPDEKPIKKKINYISDESFIESFLPKEIRGHEIKWHHLLPHPRWRSKKIPIAVLSAERSNSRRKKIMKMVRKTERPIILLFVGGGNPPGTAICVPSMYLALDVRENVIIFTWGIEMSPEQKAVFRFLLTYWDEIPGNALTFLEGLKSIPISYLN